MTEPTAWPDPHEDFDYADDDGDFDPIDDCGRWRNGQLVAQCLSAGTEFCDWDCPIKFPRSHVRKVKLNPLPLFERNTTK